MTLIKKYWPGNEPEGVEPTLWVMPGLYDGSRLNVSECIDFADTYWTKSEPQTIVFGLYLRDGSTPTKAEGLDDVMAGGMGLPTIESAAYQLLNGLPGYKTYQADWVNLLEGLASQGYVIDLVAMDVESHGLSPVTTLNTGLGSEFTMLEVAQYLYGVSNGGGTTGLPWLDINGLAMDQWSTRRGYQAYAIWNEWMWRMTADIWKEVFSAPAKKIFGNGCQVCNYDYSNYKTTPMIHWTIQGSSSGRQPRPNYAVDGVGSPVLYLNRTYFDTPEEALAALYTVELPCIPWIGDSDRTTRPPGWEVGDEDWTVNSSMNHNLLLAGIEAYGCEKVMIF